MKKTDVYEIYDVEDDYPYNHCRLVAGTLKECRDEFEGWLLEHIQSNYNTIEEFYEDGHEEVKLFIDNPNKWIEKHGNGDVEIYLDWTLDYICTV
jgi:hypothetical protein